MRVRGEEQAPRRPGTPALRTVGNVSSLMRRKKSSSHRRREGLRTGIGSGQCGCGQADCFVEFPLSIVNGKLEPKHGLGAAPCFWVVGGGQPAGGWRDGAGH